MPHYPINLDLKNKRCIVIGGGSVGERKVLMLLEFDAAVTVVSPDITKALRDLLDQGKIKHIRQVYTPEVLTSAFMVIAATDQHGVNEAISQKCRQLGLLVNVVDDPDLCNFYMPSMLRHGDFVVSVSTSGKSPSLAKRVRETLEPTFGPEYGILADILGELRDEVKAKYSTEQERVDAYRRVLDSDVLDLLAVGKRDEAMERVRKCI